MPLAYVCSIGISKHIHHLKNLSKDSHLGKNNQYCMEQQCPVLLIPVDSHLSDDMNVVSQCLEALGSWMGHNRLQPNPHKTEWL